MDVSARRVDEDKADVSTGRTVGYVGLVLGIASLFMWSVILGPIAAVVGYYAYSKGKAKRQAPGRSDSAYWQRSVILS